MIDYHGLISDSERAVRFQGYGMDVDYLLSTGLVKKNVRVLEKGPLTELLELFNSCLEDPGVIVYKYISQSETYKLLNALKYHQVPCCSYRCYVFARPLDESEKRLINPRRFMFFKRSGLSHQTFKERLKSIFKNDLSLDQLLGEVFA